MIKKRLLTALLMGGIIATGAYAQAEKGDSDDMTKKTHELNPVVVTGTGTHQRLKNTPSPVSVITANEIKRAGITDFQQALTMMVPSLSFRPNAIRERERATPLQYFNSERREITISKSIKTFLSGSENRRCSRHAKTAY